MPLNLKTDTANVKLKPKQETKFSSDEYYSKLGRLIELSDAQEQKIKKKLKRELEDWKTDTSGLRNTLERWNDLVEGVVEETDFPFRGASQIHIPITAIYLELYHNVERRSILGTERIWYAETMEDSIKEAIPDIEDALNFKARTEWNIQQALSDVFWTTDRDGLGVLQVPFVEEYEHCNDIVLIASPEDFLAEFPTPEESGLDEAGWEELHQQAQGASEEEPLEIPISYDKLTYRGPKGEVVELADFVTFPATAPDISVQYCRGYGKRFYARKGEIKKKIKEGYWYKEAGLKFLKNKRSGSNVNSFMRSKDYVEGLNRSGKSDDYEFFELVYHAELDKEEGERKFLITYSLEEDEIVACVEYPYRVDFYALFRIKKRPNRLIGQSVPQMCEDLNEEIDIQHRQRINTRTISTVPSFKGKKESLKDFDPEAEENRWRPGVVFWLSDPEAFEQFKVQPTDLGESMQEEQNDMKILSMRTGIEAFLFSGAAQPGNMDAPARKTELLINQSNMRMDDPITELRDGVEKVGEICLSHLYQFGPNMIEYQTTDQGNQTVKNSIPKRILRKGINIKMQATSVVFNPDTEFEKWMFRYKMLTQEPIIANDPVRRLEILRRALWNGRIEGRDKILPSPQEVQMMVQQEKAQMEQQAQAGQPTPEAQAAESAQAQATQVESQVRSKNALLKHVQEVAKTKQVLANTHHTTAKAVHGIGKMRKELAESKNGQG